MFLTQAIASGVNPFCAIRRNLPCIAISIVACLLLSACVVDTREVIDETQSDGGVKIGNQWDTLFGKLGVVPILPPSEDVRVGDIFVYPFNPDLQAWHDNRKRQAAISISPRWDSIDLLPQLDAEYRMRPDWPATPSAYQQVWGEAQTRKGSESGLEQGQSLYSSDRLPRRLRTFGTPEMNTFVLTDGEMNSLVPSEAINLVFGSAWNDDKAVSIRINSAETYSLGLQKVVAMALDESGPDTLLREPFRNHLWLIADQATDSVWVRILSDVIYARSVDIIIQSRNGFEEDEAAQASEFVSEVEQSVTVIEEQAAANLSAGGSDSQADAQGGEAVSETGVRQTETVSETVPDHDLDPAYAAFVRANAINEVLIEANADDVSGSLLRFVSVTDDSITVRRVWKHGVAIGARGLSLEVDKFSGAVKQSANMGTLIP